MMRRRIPFLVFIGFALADGQDTLLRPMGPCRLVFQDAFEGNVLDTSAWAYRTDSKHWSTQRPANVSLAGGYLRLEVKKEPAGGKEYTGAGIISKREFRYGYYESRFRIPAGKGWHTSFWVMRHSGSGGTATPDAYQEIDICENDSRNRTSYHVNLHDWHGVHTSSGGKAVATPDLSADFHVWGCDFTPTEARYWFDGKLVGVIDASRQPHRDASIWLTTIASPLGGTDTVDQAALPSAAVFDYVRFYELLDPVLPDTTRADSAAKPDPALPHRIVDNSDPGFSTDSPWTLSTFTGGFQGGDYLTDGSAAADPGRWAKWTPDLPRDGQYRVFMKWTSGTNRPAAAPVAIAHAEGETGVIVDQTRRNGDWVFLGEFLFAKGSAGSVRLNAGAAGFTIADAVLFEEKAPVAVRPRAESISSRDAPKPVRDALGRLTRP